MSWKEREAVREKIKEMLEEGVIRESESEFSSRVVLVKKKNGKIRMCIDYRRLNKLVEKDHYPMPVIEDILLKLKGKRYFSTLDLRNGFYHVDLEEESKKFTAFVTPDGQYEYNKLPFGFANAPAAFARYLKKVLRKFIFSGDVIVFMDDILLASETIEEHKIRLVEILRTLAENNVKLQLEKCNWLKEKIDFLGYTITKDGITPNEEHIIAIKEYPVPLDVKEVQRFLGLVGYFRKFIRNFKDIAASLQKIIRTEVYKWGEEEQEAFEGLKEIMMKHPILRIFDPMLETELHTDASANGFGAILLQKKGNEVFPVSYFSKRSNSAEQKLHSFELETLAVLYSLRRFRPYLLGSNFKIITDCNAMRLTLQKMDINAKIERWALEMEEFDFDIEHRVGEKMHHVVALSRVYMMTAEEKLEDELEEEAELEERDMWKMKLMLAQTKDENTQKTIQDVKSGQQRGYVERERILYKECGERLQLVIPEKMVSGVLHKMNDNRGYMGIKRQ